MCEKVVGTVKHLPETAAWKVVLRSDTKHGPFRLTNFLPDGWSFPAYPGIWNNQTSGGYHVFRSWFGAWSYRRELFPTKLKVIKVKIRGKAVPFRRYIFRGWAVEQWKPGK